MMLYEEMYNIGDYRDAQNSSFWFELIADVINVNFTNVGKMRILELCSVVIRYFSLYMFI